MLGFRNVDQNFILLAPHAVTELALVKVEPEETLGPIIRSSYLPVAQNEDLQIRRLVGSNIWLELLFSTGVQVIRPRIGIQAHCLVVIDLS